MVGGYLFLLFAFGEDCIGSGEEAVVKRCGDSLRMGTSFSVWLGVFVCLIVVRSGAEVENGSAREEGVIGHGEHVVRGVVGREGLNGRSEVALHGSGRKIWRAPIRADGAFVLFDIPDGKYSLRVGSQRRKRRV